MAVAPADGSSSGQTPANEYGPNVLFVRFRDGVDTAAGTQRLAADADQLGDANEITVIGAQRSAEIVNADSISGASAWLAAAIALASVTSFVLALLAIVRRRQRDLALLKALGFTHRQVSMSVAWHAVTVVVAGLVVGVPTGLLIGRATWNMFARQLDVLAEPTVSAVSVAAIVIAALATAVAFGALASRRARRVPAGIVLRNE